MNTRTRPKRIPSQPLSGSEIASDYVQPRIGSDIALMKGIAKAVLEEQSFENRMLKNYIRNWPASEDEGQ